MPQSSQSDSTQVTVTVVPDTLVTASPDTSSTQYPRSASCAWQDSMIKAQTLQPGHDIEVTLAGKAVRTAKKSWTALKFFAKQLGEWWNEENEKIEELDDGDT